VCQKDGPDAFGKIKSGHLKIVTQLLPCKLRRYCATIFDGVNTQATNRRFDLHCSKRTNELRCQTPDVGLDIHDAAVDVWLDYDVSSDLDFDQLSSCSFKCGLAAIYIFRLHQQQYYQGESIVCIDHFMILKEIDPEERVYHRIGILVVIGHDQSHRDRWFKEVWSASVLPLEDIIIE
jgi:hypothetical protein